MHDFDLHAPKALIKRNASSAGAKVPEGELPPVRVIRDSSPVPAERLIWALKAARCPCIGA